MTRLHSGTFNVNHPFNKTALFWAGEVYMPLDMAYVSRSDKWADFLSLNERFEQRWAKPYGYVMSD